MSLYSNYECPSCKGKGQLKDGGNVWDCENCDGKGIISNAYIIWASSKATNSKTEAEIKDNHNNN